MTFTSITQASALTLNDLRLPVHLGCSVEERKNSQMVRFEVRLRFDRLPQGCLNDQLKDTVCYAKICDQIRNVCQRSEYQLIEKLAWDSFASLKEIIPLQTQLWLKVTKEKPPVSDLEGGASFSIGDWDIG
jgi:7,8-dihydroneopterin aldolase/epimerase/oxygenase